MDYTWSVNSTWNLLTTYKPANHDILMTVLHKWKIMNYNHEKLDFISLIVSKKKPDVIIL